MTPRAPPRVEDQSEGQPTGREPIRRMDWGSRTNQKDDRRVKAKLIKRTNGGARTNQKDNRLDEYQSETVTEVSPSDERRGGDQSESSPSISRSDGGTTTCYPMGGN